MTDILLELEGSLPRIAPAREARQLGAILDKVAEKSADIERQGQRCQALVAMATALDGFSDPKVTTAARAAIDAVRTTGADLTTAADVDGLELVLESLIDLANALKDFDQNVRLVWADRSRTEYTSLIPVGQLLQHIAGAEALGQELAQLGARATALASRNQTATAMAPDIEQLEADRRSLLARLKEVTANPEVETFITAVTQNQATLQLVTPGVLGWLSDRGALGAFKITG